MHCQCDSRYAADILPPHRCTTLTFSTTGYGWGMHAQMLKVLELCALPRAMIPRCSRPHSRGRLAASVDPEDPSAAWRYIMFAPLSSSTCHRAVQHDPFLTLHGSRVCCGGVACGERQASNSSTVSSGPGCGESGASVPRCMCAATETAGHAAPNAKGGRICAATRSARLMAWLWLKIHHACTVVQSCDVPMRADVTQACNQLLACMG